MMTRTLGAVAREVQGRLVGNDGSFGAVTTDSRSLAAGALFVAIAGDKFDGNDFGQGECTFFMYGPDADVLYMVIEVVLQEFPVARGGYAIKRYGPAEDPNSKEVRVTW